MHIPGISGILLLSSLFIFSLMILQPVSASVYLLNGTEVPRDQIRNATMGIMRDQTESPASLDFFYSHNCQSCQQALDYLRSFEKKNPDIPVTHYNLVYSRENQNLFTQYKSRFNTTRISYPAIFQSSIALSGSSDIIHYTEMLARGI